MSNLVGRRRAEATRSARMQRNEIHESPAVPRQLRELQRVNLLIIDAAEHHVLECDATIECLRRLDDVAQRILDVDRHEVAAQVVVRRMN